MGKFASGYSLAVLAKTTLGTFIQCNENDFLFNFKENI